FWRRRQRQWKENQPTLLHCWAHGERVLRQWPFRIDLCSGRIRAGWRIERGGQNARTADRRQKRPIGFAISGPSGPKRLPIPVVYETVAGRFYVDWAVGRHRHPGRDAVARARQSPRHLLPEQSQAAPTLLVASGQRGWYSVTIKE